MGLELDSSTTASGLNHQLRELHITHNSKPITVMAYKGTIGILTGGGDVPGLNPAIRAVTVRANREGYRVIGLRRGWAGIVDMVPDKDFDNSENFIHLTEDVVNRAARTGGTFLHSSRTRPSTLPQSAMPDHLKSTYTDEVNDVTPTVMKNLEWLGIDTMIPIGGDDTLSYGHRLHAEGMKVVAIPKTMDNDVPGTDYCIGFSTCISRTIQLTHDLRTSAGSHERFLVIEVFGRYAGFTSLLPAMAGAADRCVIPEHVVDPEHLTEMMVYSRNQNPSKYAVCIVSEGATLKGDSEMQFSGDEADQFGHKKLGGIGERIGSLLKHHSAQFNNGRKINIVNQKLGYLVRCGAPDALDAIAPMAFGNLALDLVLKGESGRLVSIRNGKYTNVPVDFVDGTNKKLVDVAAHYNTERLRPIYDTFENSPLLIMTSGM